MTLDLAWRIERVCRAAWPGTDEIECGDWLLRCSGGDSRRANSANPLRDPTQDVDAGIAACEAFYRPRGRPSLFRIPSIISHDVDERLDGLAYSYEGETCTLFAPIATLTTMQDSHVEISERPSAEWLATMNRLQGHSDAQKLAYGCIIDSIGPPVGFAALRSEGEFASLAIGVICDRLLCFESVVTDGRYRGRGYARRVLSSLIAWAAAESAEGGCLQVVADNAPARKLYDGIGFKTELYRYHYRRESSA